MEARTFDGLVVTGTGRHTSHTCTARRSDQGLGHGEELLSTATAFVTIPFYVPELLLSSDAATANLTE